MISILVGNTSQGNAILFHDFILQFQNFDGSKRETIKLSNNNNCDIDSLLNFLASMAPRLAPNPTSETENIKLNICIGTCSNLSMLQHVGKEHNTVSIPKHDRDLVAFDVAFIVAMAILSAEAFSFFHSVGHCLENFVLVKNFIWNFVPIG